MMPTAAEFIMGVLFFAAFIAGVVLSLKGSP